MSSSEKILRIGENSPEQIALKLFETIAAVEERELHPHGPNPADRSWILDTYAECLIAVRGHRHI